MMEDSHFEWQKQQSCCLHKDWPELSKYLEVSANLVFLEDSYACNHLFATRTMEEYDV